MPSFNYRKQDRHFKFLRATEKLDFYMAEFVLKHWTKHISKMWTLNFLIWTCVSETGKESLGHPKKYLFYASQLIISTSDVPPGPRADQETFALVITSFDYGSTLGDTILQDSL